MKARHLLAVTAMTAVTGCSVGGLLGQTAQAPGGGTSGQACRWLGEQAADAAQARLDLVLLVDRSASARDGQGRAWDWYRAVFGGEGTAVGDAVTFPNTRLPTPARIRIGAFDGEGSVEWVVGDLLLPHLTATADGYRSSYALNVGDCLRDAVGRAAASPPREPGSAVLGALDVDRAPATAPDAEHRLVVATDGLSTQGCASLERTAMRDLTIVGRIVRACQGQRAVPDLRGWRVEMPWLGHPGADRPQPRQSHRKWLTSLWSGLCAATGAHPCRIADGRPTDPAQGTPGVPVSVADPVIAFSSTERAPDPFVKKVLPEDLLFPTGSAVLHASGRELLTRFADELAGQAPESVRVAGYADDRGGTTYNEDLSRRRARAVGDVLRQAGLRGVRTEGRGEVAGNCPSPSAGDTKACNRRVEIVYRVRG
ncbi:OmpA family protein [Streptosporangium sp. NPDC000239]|uniref:OmpA family protein n=1 Tax=unclassified Streptosporangium TaxID=2632669 RepID=UPI003332269F